MKRILLTFTVCFFLATTIMAQQDYEPTVLFLYPNQTIVSDSAKSELEEFEQEVEITDEIRKNYVKADLAPNWKIIRNSELDFIALQDYFSTLVIFLSRELTYKESDYHDFPLIYPVKETCGKDLARLKVLADTYKVSWVVNCVRVETEVSEGKRKLSVHIQMYNAMTKRLFIDSVYKADDTTSESCPDEGWLCTIENIKKDIVKDMVDRVEKNRQYHRKM